MHKTDNIIYKQIIDMQHRGILSRIEYGQIKQIFKNSQIQKINKQKSSIKIHNTKHRHIRLLKVITNVIQQKLHPKYNIIVIILSHLFYFKLYKLNKDI